MTMSTNERKLRDRLSQARMAERIAYQEADEAKKAAEKLTAVRSEIESILENLFPSGDVP